MTVSTYVFVLLLSCFCSVHIEGYHPDIDNNDETEVLKCKVAALEKSSKEQGELMKKMELKIKVLEAGEREQNQSLDTLAQQASKISTYCALLPPNVCGECSCLDDTEHKNKWYCDCQSLKPRRDCVDFLQHGHKVNGVYRINTGGMKEMQVFCDQQTDGGGWSVVQRRVNGEINFYRNWHMYKYGFGPVQREFWIGNDNLHVLTLQAAYPKGSELRIDMRDWNEKKLYAKYSTFSIENEEAKYKLHVASFAGNAGDSFGGHNGQKFSTYDQDNDVSSSSCSRQYRGSWWYSNCHSCNLNGEYRWFDVKQPAYARGVIWYTYKNSHEYSMKGVEMKVRRKL